MTPESFALSLAMLTGASVGLVEAFAPWLTPSSKPAASIVLGLLLGGVYLLSPAELRPYVLVMFCGATATGGVALAKRLGGPQ